MNIEIVKEKMMMMMMMMMMLMMMMIKMMESYRDGVETGSSWKY